MVLCASCESHRRPGDGPCPWCGQAPRLLTPLGSAAAALLCLTLVGCPVSQPKYGVTVTDAIEDTGDTAEETTTANR